MYFFWGILGIIAWILVAFLPARWAQKKGYNFFLFLLLSWFVSFIVTLLIVLFLKDKNETSESQAAQEAVDEVLDEEMSKG